MFKIFRDLLLLRLDAAYFKASLEWNLRRRFSRTRLGVSWPLITFALYTLVFIGLSGIFFGLRGANNVAYIVFGIMTWIFISSSLLEAANALVINKYNLFSARKPLILYIIVPVISNYIMFFVNAVFTFVIVFFFFESEIGVVNILYFLLGSFLLLLVLLIGAVILAILNAAIRDMLHALNAIMSVGMLITPVWWHPSILENPDAWYIRYNPFYSLIELVRAPALGYAFPIDSMIVVIYAATTFLLALIAYAIYSEKIMLRL